MFDLTVFALYNALLTRFNPVSLRPTTTIISISFYASLRRLLKSRLLIIAGQELGHKCTL